MMWIFKFLPGSNLTVGVFAGLWLGFSSFTEVGEVRTDGMHPEDWEQNLSLTNAGSHDKSWSSVVSKTAGGFPARLPKRLRPMIDHYVRKFVESQERILHATSNLLFYHSSIRNWIWSEAIEQISGALCRCSTNTVENYASNHFRIFLLQKWQ